MNLNNNDGQIESLVVRKGELLPAAFALRNSRPDLSTDLQTQSQNYLLRCADIDHFNLPYGKREAELETSVTIPGEAVSDLRIGLDEAKMMMDSNVSELKFWELVSKKARIFRAERETIKNMMDQLDSTTTI